MECEASYDETGSVDREVAPPPKTSEGEAPSGESGPSKDEPAIGEDGPAIDPGGYRDQ